MVVLLRIRWRWTQVGKPPASCPRAASAVTVILGGLLHPGVVHLIPSNIPRRCSTGEQDHQVCHVGRQAVNLIALNRRTEQSPLSQQFWCTRGVFVAASSFLSSSWTLLDWNLSRILFSAHAVGSQCVVRSHRSSIIAHDRRFVGGPSPLLQTSLRKSPSSGQKSKLTIRFKGADFFLFEVTRNLVPSHCS